jgi:hypothetical protein
MEMKIGKSVLELVKGDITEMQTEAIVNAADANTIYPKVTAEQLDAARKVLAEDLEQKPSRAEMPDWIARCSEPSKRIILFLAGALLILISFICFGPAKQSPREQ